MTSQKDLKKYMVALLSSVTDIIHQLRSEVVALRLDMDSQHIRNDNFNDRLINLEENKIKVIDEELIIQIRNFDSEIERLKNYRDLFEKQININNAQERTNNND